MCGINALRLFSAVGMLLTRALKLSEIHESLFPSDWSKAQSSGRPVVVTLLILSHLLHMIGLYMRVLGLSCHLHDSLFAFFPTSWGEREREVIVTKWIFSWDLIFKFNVHDGTSP